MTLEREVEAYLIKRVKELGGEVRKVKWIGRRGAPDRLVLLPRRPVTYGAVQIDSGPSLYWVELKRPGAEADAHQTREHNALKKFKQNVWVIDSKERVDWLLD